MRSLRVLLVAASVITVGAPANAIAATGRPGLRVDPETVRVTSFFDGTSVEVTGLAPPDTELAVLVTGDPQPVDLRVKGKVWGLFWMNVATVHFDDVPAVYLLASSTHVCELAPFAERRRVGLGLDVLDAQSVTDDDPTRRELFGELVAMKQRSKLYGVFEGDLRVEPQPSGTGAAAFSASIPVPAGIPEGRYTVTLWGFTDGSGAPLATTEVAVEAVGTVHEIRDLAQSHGLAYGMIALVVALVVGLATGFPFGLAGKGAH